MIKDCFGVVALVGDHIFFSQGKSGGQFRDWCDKTKLRRPEGDFVIDVGARDV